METRRHIREIIITTVLIILWGFTGGLKLLTRMTFSNQLSGEGIEHQTAEFLSYLIPITMTLTGMLLVYSLVNSSIKKAVLLLSIFFLLLFIGYMSNILLFVRPMPCSCIALTDLLSWEQQLSISIIILLLNLAELIIHIKEQRHTAIHKHIVGQQLGQAEHLNTK